MAAYTAIAEVSKTLIALLRTAVENREEVLTLDAENISLSDPTDVSPDDQTRLSVSLYHLEENAATTNTQPRHQTETTVAEGSPLGVDLYYLLTAHPGDSDDSTAQRLEQQRVLGFVLQTFHDNRIVRGEQLTDELEADEPLTISLVDDSRSERTNRWSTTPETAFQPSVLYRVSPAVIDSKQRETLTPVTERETRLERQPES